MTVMICKVAPPPYTIEDLMRQKNIDDGKGSAEIEVSTAHSVFDKPRCSICFHDIPFRC